MIVETIRALTDAMNGTSYGVNTQLSSIPVDAGDSTPTLLASITDETRNDEVAVGRYPTTYPCIVVTQAGPAELGPEVYNFDYRDGKITVLIRFITTNTETAAGHAATMYTFRAITRCLTAWGLNSNQADRIRNGIQIVSCEALEQVDVWENITDATITAGIKAKFYVRDTQP